ncbi:uncharacterized protein LOC144751251 [Ciona intestinalis]
MLSLKIFRLAVILLLLSIMYVNADNSMRSELTASGRKYEESDCGGTVNDTTSCDCPDTGFECDCKKTNSCKGLSCIPIHQVCDGVAQCNDRSDESNCTCNSNQVRCGCIFQTNCTADAKCIDRRWYLLNGRKDCSDGSDEPCVASDSREDRCLFKLLHCSNRKLKDLAILHLRNNNDPNYKCWNVSRCTEDQSCRVYWRCVLVVGVSSGKHCTVFVENTNSLLQCNNGELIRGNQICSQDKYCGSMQTNNAFRCKPKPLYRCTQEYITISEHNLYDSDSNCADKSDLCFIGDLKCFRCLHSGELISLNQICDEIMDCRDFSDECLCRNQSTCLRYKASRLSCPPEMVIFIEENTCMWSRQACIEATLSNISSQAIISCAGNNQYQYGVKCDGNFECPYMEDDCGNCTNRPAVCDRKCWHIWWSRTKHCDGYPYSRDETTNIGIWTTTDGVYHFASLDTIIKPLNMSLYALFKIMNNTKVTNATLITDLARSGGVSESQVSDVIIRMVRATPGDFLRRVRRWMDFHKVFLPFCDSGFDEVNCTNRHYCKSGVLVSIDKSRVCDGKTDCDDGSDEPEGLCKSKLFYCVNKTPLFVDRERVEDGIKDCSDGSDECPENTYKSTIFSSQVDMIGNLFLRGAFWVMGFFALVGNFVVIVSNILKLKTFSKNAATVNSNGWLILNLATSDLLMGVYLLSIGIKGILFSGTYCYHDIEWRSSQSCSLLGATALLSSETSIFIMTIMTTQRLFIVYKPIAMRNVRFRFTFVPTVVAWGLGLLGVFIIIKWGSVSLNGGLVKGGLYYHLNLATSDLLMGVYLLSIVIKGSLFSGTYCYHDIEWRSSQSCSLLGATALLSSETSIFIMTIMTTQRLFIVYKPISMRNVRFRFTFVPTVVAWGLGLLVALIPLLRNASGYFTIAVWYPNKFYKTNEISRLNMIKLATRMTNTSPASWEHTKDIVSQKVPLFKIHRDVHYYGFTSVCMPKLFLHIGEETWEYSISIITINFVLFLYMLVGYIVIYKKSTKMAPPSAADARKQSMQNRIFRLIVTDFLCWIPICIMVYISLSGVKIDRVVYATSAGILLPLNSALNPLLYSQVISSRVYSLYTYVVQRWQTSYTPPNPPEITMDQLNEN